MTTIRKQLLARIPVTEHELHPAGIPTAVLEGGQGRPLVLLHGQGEFAATWMRAIPGLVDSYRVVIPDLPGHGASGIGDAGLDPDRMMAWLGQLIAQTCPSPPVLIGHLLGGAIAARFAVHHSDRLERLVLVDTLGLRWYRPTAAFGLAAIGFMARPSEHSRDRLFDQCFVDRDSVHEQMGGDMDLLEAYALDCARRPELKAALRSLMPRIGVPPIRPDDLAGLDVSTALIWGREDRQTPVKTAKVAAARYGWPLEVIEGAADDPAHERPEAFLSALRPNLTAHTPVEQRSTS